jgi:hypothetical protein
MATPQKRSAAGSNDPLLEVGVLQNVLSYVGRGHHLFVAPVSKRWREVYAKSSLQLRVYKYSSSSTVSCDPYMTLYSSVFASSARVQLAHESGLDCSSKEYQLAAGRYASVATLAVAHELVIEHTVTMMRGAAECNKLAEVQYLQSQGCPWHAGLLDVAASGGHAELVRWCYEHCCPWSGMVPYYTAEGGNAELMAWVLQQPQTQLSGIVMRIAAEKGHLAVCKLLRAQQCPWDARSTRKAALYGRARVLRWLVDNGCPYEGRDLCDSAADCGSVKTMAYLQQQGILWGAGMLTHMLERAAHNNKLTAVKWLRAQGALLQTRSVFRRRRWSGEMLEWAISKGYTACALVIRGMCCYCTTHLHLLSHLLQR